MRFLIIGDVLFDKEDERKYKQYLLELSADYPAIKFLGYRNDIEDLLEDIDVLVHASTREEPFGRVILEGMASHKPVVASGIGGPVEILEDQLSGILFKPGNHLELATYLAMLLNDKNKYNFIAENGYQRFRDMFDIRQTVANIESVIQEVVSR